MKISKLYFERLPSNIEKIGPVVKEILTDIEGRFGPLKDDCHFELKVILNEIVLNAVKHGNQECLGKLIKVGAFALDKGFVGIVVEDEGEGYSYNTKNGCSSFAEEDLCDMLESGRGILLVNSLCDRVKVNARGNKISVLKKIDSL